MIPIAFVAPLLEVRNLSLHPVSAPREAAILHDISFQLGWGEILGIAGGTRAVTSVLVRALFGLLAPDYQITGGWMAFDGERLEDPALWERLRGRRIAIMARDAKLDPLTPVGSQIEETVCADGVLSQREGRDRTLELMKHVGISDPDRCYRYHPHQFSEVQRQRLAIALALASSPDVIIAEEPMSELDTDAGEQILRLLRTLVDESGISIVLTMHNVGMLADVSDRVIALDAGPTADEGQPAATMESVLEDDRVE